MEKLYYTIGEVADIMKVSVSLVRFWSNSFPYFAKIKRNAKGNRLYRVEDIAVLKQIQHLVKVKGMTLEGAQAELALNSSSVVRRVRTIESLKEIRRQLAEIRNFL